jgi:Asp-tRNA(Asn)/Glu-tRNA(Gln) amidotransferase A subunit family amidase
MPFLLSLLIGGCLSLAAQPAPPPIDRDLMEITVPRLEGLYAAHTYTVRQVTQWYLDRIGRYNDVYKPILHLNVDGALATAAAEDEAAARGGRSFRRGALWGVPVVIKSNTSVKGLVTSEGWKGFLIPGHELIASADATIVAKLKAAGVVILGQTNMPDFAGSDTNISTAFGRTGNAYNWRFSPGGSSGGTVTSVTANLALVGTGTDTANSIRMPAATSAVVGMMPTRGLVSIAGIGPLDWLRDNTGPIARDVTDAAIALGVMAGEDPKDFKTAGSTRKAQRPPYTAYLKPDALRGKRFGIPAFMMSASEASASGARGNVMESETRQLFLAAVDGMRKAGATIVVDGNLLPASFAALTAAVDTRPYKREGMENFLRDFGPAEYHSSAEYAKAVGAPLPATAIGSGDQRTLETDPAAEATYFAPQRKALTAYHDALDAFHLDGLVYPGLSIASADETIEHPGVRSPGPHSNTGWANRIGVPAIVVPGGYYANGLPFGLELSARQWKDGDLLGWAFAYEQATKYRKPPVLVDRQQ